MEIKETINDKEIPEIFKSLQIIKNKNIILDYEKENFIINLGKYLPYVEFDIETGTGGNTLFITWKDLFIIYIDSKNIVNYVSYLNHNIQLSLETY
jgi:hypothetical protein